MVPLASLWECGVAPQYILTPHTFAKVLHYFKQKRSHLIARGALSRISTKALCLFQNSLVREVEDAKKQLEETQHDKVLKSVTHLDPH